MTNTPKRISFDRDDKNFTVRDWLETEIAYYEDLIERKESSYETTTVSEWLFWTISAVVVVILFFLAGVTMFTNWLLPPVAEVYGVALNPQWLVLVLIFIYLAAGLRQIDTSEVAGLDFAGKPVLQLGNGLKWYPWLLFKLSIETVHLTQGELPGDADRIFWGEEEEEMPSGMVRPIFVLSGENPRGGLPSDKQINLGVSMLVKIKIIQDRFFDLIINIAPVDEKNGQMIRDTITGNQSVTPRLLEVLRHLRDTSSAFASALVGKLSYNEITHNRALVDELYHLRVKLEVLDWGLDLKEARFTKFNPGHTYNSDLQKRSTAASERDATIMQAEGKRKALMLEGEGEASKRRKFLQAEAEGQQAIRDALEISGDTVIAAEVGKEIAKGGNAVIADGIGGLGALFAAGTEKFKKTKKGDSADTE